ncbi:hypothetical protein AGMMS49546_08260 [Spirochaetia bacterium]|nr:hypothetical protein AGMMS49546_08260 [Spirochaetia bacterium]
MKNKSVKFCRFLLGGAFIISLLALGSCMMPDLKPELYFSSSRKAPVENSPGSGGTPPSTPPSTPLSTPPVPNLVVPNFSTVPGGYTGPALITYMSGATLSVDITAAGTLEYDPSLTVPAGALKSITLPSHQPYLIGRDAPGAVLPIVLNLDTNGELMFRPPVSGGSIPIGSYAEFQLINNNPAIMGQGYKQEADLDLMGGEPGVPDWTPVGTSTQPFAGIYDGGGKKLTRLRINTTDNNVGLFGEVAGGTVKNLGIDSGTVSGGNNVGGVAGVNSGEITACYNAAKVTGKSNVGGIAGSADTITACYNTGTVNGTGSNIGGVAGLNQGSISACYNTGTVGGSSPSGGVEGFSQGGSMDACYFISTNTSGMTGGGGADSFTASVPFTPPDTTEWGTVGSGGGEPGQYWQPGTTDGTQLPRLWFE